MRHTDFLRELASWQFTDQPRTAGALQNAARYIESLERANDELRRASATQLEMRVEAQARAARLAKDARR